MPIFRCEQCTQELSTGDEFIGYQIQCPSCNAVMAVPAGTVVPVAIVPAPREPAFYGAIYTFLIITGTVLAGYIYLIKFDRLKETELVALTPAWLFPLVFGIYGFVAQKLIRLVQTGQAATIGQAVKIWTVAFGWFGLLLLLPFLPLKNWRNSLLTAFVASLFWGLLMVIFFSAIFPKL